MGERAGRERRLIGMLAAGLVAVGLLLAIWAAASGPSLDWSPNTGSDEPAIESADQQDRSIDPCEGDRCKQPDRRDGNAVGVVLTVILVVLGVALLCALIALLRAAQTGVFSRRQRPFAAPGEALPDVGGAVRDDARAQYEALRTGTPRNAIVACWVRLEDAVTSAGLTVRGSETSAELTHRVLAKYGVDDAAITRLAALYREARFSRHDVTEEMRTEAIDALERIHASLDRRAADRPEVPR